MSSVNSVAALDALYPDPLAFLDSNTVLPASPSKLERLARESGAIASAAAFEMKRVAKTKTKLYRAMMNDDGKIIRNVDVKETRPKHDHERMFNKKRRFAKADGKSVYMSGEKCQDLTILLGCGGIGLKAHGGT